MEGDLWYIRVQLVLITDSYIGIRQSVLNKWQLESLRKWKKKKTTVVRKLKFSLESKIFVCRWLYDMGAWLMLCITRVLLGNLVIPQPLNKFPASFEFESLLVFSPSHLNEEWWLSRPVAIRNIEVWIIRHVIHNCALTMFNYVVRDTVWPIEGLSLKPKQVARKEIKCCLYIIGTDTSYFHPSNSTFSHHVCEDQF